MHFPPHIAVPPILVPQEYSSFTQPTNLIITRSVLMSLIVELASSPGSLLENWGRRVRVSLVPRLSPHFLRREPGDEAIVEHRRR